MRAIHVALAQLEREAKPYTVVQIGAYVGNSDSDPLWERFRQPQKYGKLIAVEPIVEHYRKLVVNYTGCPWVTCLPCAVAEGNGTVLMYKLGVKAEDHGFPEWLNQLSSLKKERMEELWEGSEGKLPAVTFDNSFYLEHRVTESVPAITLKTLRGIYKLASIDLLVIDVEGYEPEILAQIDFPVRYLQYEHTLLYQVEDVRILFELEAKGYECVRCQQDTFCWQTGDAVEAGFAKVLEKHRGQ